MKKIEIEIEEAVLDKIVDVLNDSDLLAQTEFIESPTTKEKDARAGVLFSSSRKRLSVICSNSQKDKLIARLFPLINMFGGFCACSDLI